MQRPRAYASLLLAWLIVSVSGGIASAGGQAVPPGEPPEGRPSKPEPDAATARRSRAADDEKGIRDAADAVKPLPEAPIPDDPPPHEGAILERPYVIEAPDLVIVDVIEAIPGRPIAGEHLVRPDGTISLGFYGDVHVQGLTPRQAKAKIIHHLRRFLTDEVLGLYVISADSLEGPMDEELQQPAPAGEKAKPDAAAGDDTDARPKGARRGRRRRDRERPRPSAPAREDGKNGPKAEDAAPQGLPPEKVIDGLKFRLVPPEESLSVNVDIGSYNSKFYHVEGDTATTGRFPVTGRETVLQAIEGAGGLLSIADRGNIKLVRPARAGKPARVYPIDLKAIVEKGDTRANLQVFPGDRIVVGRDPVATTAAAVDRATASAHSALNSMLLSSMLARSLLPAAGTGAPVIARFRMGALTWTLESSGKAPELTPAQREAAAAAWVDFWSKVAARAGGADGDDALLREMLLRHLNPPAPEAKPADAPK